jgi:hypothetical protein
MGPAHHESEQKLFFCVCLVEASEKEKIINPKIKRGRSKMCGLIHKNNADKDEDDK